MIDIHSKCDNMHKNGMYYALICINNQIILCINCIISLYQALIILERPFLATMKANTDLGKEVILNKAKHTVKVNIDNGSLLHFFSSI